jgi:hypothetical protein
VNTAATASALICPRSTRSHGVSTTARIKKRSKREEDRRNLRQPDLADDQIHTPDEVDPEEQGKIARRDAMPRGRGRNSAPAERRLLGVHAVGLFGRRVTKV